MMGGAKAHYDGIKAFSETDFNEDLKNNQRSGTVAFLRSSDLYGRRAKSIRGGHRGF